MGEEESVREAFGEVVGLGVGCGKKPVSTRNVVYLFLYVSTDRSLLTFVDNFSPLMDMKKQVLNCEVLA